MCKKCKKKCCGSCDSCSGSCTTKTCPSKSTCLDKAMCAIKGITIRTPKYQGWQFTAPVLQFTVTAGTLPVDSNLIRCYLNGQRVPFGLVGNYYFSRAGQSLTLNKLAEGTVEEPGWFFIEFEEEKTIEDIVKESDPAITFCC